VEIPRLSIIEGSKKARCLTVVNNVFRAFTTAAYVMANRAKRIHPVGNFEESFKLK
jgi:2-phosphosulfolactate phosphatase